MNHACDGHKLLKLTSRDQAISVSINIEIINQSTLIGSDATLLQVNFFLHFDFE